VTVALSGEGADELFGGYLTYQADRMAKPFRLVPAGIRRLMRSGLDRYMPVSDEKISLEYKLKRWIEGSLLNPDEAHFFWNGTFSPEQLRQIRPGTRGNTLQHMVEDLPQAASGVLNRYLNTDQNFYLADDILYKTDRMSMAHSLEVRPPFLDHRIVEFAASLPQRLKIRGGTQKFVLRELMRGKLPETVLKRKKTGFDIPTHDWFRGALRPLLMDTVTPEAIAATGIFDARAIETLIRDHMERRINAGYHLWGLLTLFLWMKRWKVEAPPRTEAAPQENARVFAIS
jgi:asparagine synthase (glutamine-hydrolysing)